VTGAAPPPESTAPVAVVGLGYAGLPLAVAAAAAGYQVRGVDIAAARVDQINRSSSPVDTVTSAALAAARPRLHATTDPGCLPHCSTIVVCVPTPLDGDGQPDLRPLRSATATVRDHLRSGQLVIVESTTYPGTTDGPLREILQQSGLTAGADFALAYSPERVDPGNTDYTLTNTPKLVGGLTEGCRDRAAVFYRALGAPVHLTRGTREAEAAKILENTQRQVNIALVNEFAQLCHHMGVDVWDTLAAAATKPFGYIPYRPGPGVGGHCIPADPMYLVHRAGEMGIPSRLAQAAQDINDGMPLWVADRICKHLECAGVELADADVLLLGVTYKPDIADTRNTPATAIITELRGRGVPVRFHDPYVIELDTGTNVLRRTEDLADALGDATLSVLLQRHRAYDAELLADARALFDTTGPATAIGDVAL
jgi:nucleotide sugar dehydrogenase